MYSSIVSSIAHDVKTVQRKITISTVPTQWKRACLPCSKSVTAMQRCPYPLKTIRIRILFVQTLLIAVRILSVSVLLTEESKKIILPRHFRL